jgi:hypothetical protein
LFTKIGSSIRSFTKIDSWSDLIRSGWAWSRLIGPNPDWLGLIPIDQVWLGLVKSITKIWSRFWRAPDSIKLTEIAARKSAKLPFPKFLRSVPAIQ